MQPESTRQFFIELYRDFLAKGGVRLVEFSQTVGHLPNPSMCNVPRIDLVLKGEKHMLSSCNTSVKDLHMPAGSAHYAAPMTAKMPLWDSPHDMSGLVFMGNFLRVTHISIDKSLDVQEIDAPVWYHTHVPPTEDIRVICSILNRHAKSGGIAEIDAELVNLLIKLIIRELEQDNNIKTERSRVTWRLAAEYIHENFARFISRESVARHLHVSPGYLSRLCREECGCSFIEYLRLMRLEFAAQLLRETNNTISEITEQCGYQSPTFFAAAFKRHFKVTPKEYRSYTPH